MSVDELTTKALADAWDEEPGNEPWVPAGMWVPKAGDRVEIHRSAECVERFDFMHAEHHPDGTVGTVGGTYESFFGEKMTGDGHNVFVRFGTDDEGRDDCSWFAVSELIPLEPAHRASDGGRA